MHKRRHSTCPLLTGAFVFIAVSLVISADAFAIRDATNQGRWNKPCKNGPDAVVPGFLVNMGPTGARGILKARSYVVKYIFPSSPASGVLKLDDEVYGANGKEFATHTFGGGKHGLAGPMRDLGLAIEDSEGSDGVLHLMLRRGGASQTVAVQLEKLGRFADTFPVNCRKTEILKARAYRYLMNHPGGLGSQGRCVATLAMLSSDDPKVFAAGKRLAQSWNRPYNKSTWSWHLGFQGITLAEYYLLTGDKAVLGTLASTMDLLRHAQWKGPKIQRWKAKEFKNVDQATLDRHQALYEGGFGHCPYPEVVRRGGGGYGPMQRPTYLAILAWQLGKQCGIEVKHPGIETGFQFVEYGTNMAGLTAYGGEFTLNNGPIDPARWKSSTRNGCSHKSGMAYLLYRLSPERPESAGKMKLHLSNIDAAYKDMPDGHACPMMGLVWGWAGVYASDDVALKKKITNYYKAWINLARCHGSDSYVILPGRNYADGSYYRDNIRNHTTASIAFLYSYSTPKCQVQGVSVSIPGVNHLALKGAEALAYKSILRKSYGAGAKALSALPDVDDPKSTAGKIMAHIAKCSEAALQDLAALEQKGEWFALEESLKKALPAYRGVPAFDKQATHWREALASKEGKQMVTAHRLFLAGYYGSAMTALKGTDARETVAAAAAVLLETVEGAVREYVDRCKALYEQGEWNTLRSTLARERKRMKGASLFDASCAKWDAALKSSSGDRIISADRMFSSGQLGASAKALAAVATDSTAASEVKAIARTVETRVEAKVQSLLKAFLVYEQEGDWYALNRELPTAARNLRGIASFETHRNRWKEKMGSQEVKRAMVVGRMYKTLETAWSRSKGRSERRDLEAFAKQFHDMIYGKRAKALLGEPGS